MAVPYPFSIMGSAKTQPNNNIFSPILMTQFIPLQSSRSSSSCILIPGKTDKNPTGGTYYPLSFPAGIYSPFLSLCTIKCFFYTYVRLLSLSLFGMKNMIH